MNGRKSMMWGTKSAKSSDSNLRAAQLLQRPNTASSAAFKTPARPSSSRQVQDPNTPKAKIKRITDIGVVEITDILKAESQEQRRISLWAPNSDGKGFDEYQKDFPDIIKELMPTNSGRYTASPRLDAFDLHLRSFQSADSEALIRATPTLLQSIRKTQRVGFVGAPKQPRSDIYLTLWKPSLNMNAFLSHPAAGSVPMPADLNTSNLQLTLEVRNASGTRISNCIFAASNSSGHTAWRTVAVENGEPWDQTIRLAIDPKDVPGCHIIMSIADGPKFPFALCWMPLWVDEAFVADGAHALALYSYDEHTAAMIAGKGAYLRLAWAAKNKDETVTGLVASLELRTYLCSTKYSSNSILLGIIKWREVRSKGLIPLLKRFEFVPEIEVVKLLPDVFDALFEALVEYAGNDEIEDSVFSALVRVSGIIHDRRFNLEPLVDEYAMERFNFPFAFPCLMRSFVRLLSDSSTPDISRRLRATCKVAHHILKFMVNARQQQIVKEVGIGIKGHSPTFAKDLQSIFQAVEKLMIKKDPVLIGTKTLIVQNFHTWLPELTAVLSPEEILSIAIGFVDSCSAAEGRLILYKLVLIMNLSTTAILTTSNVQRSWHESTLRWLDPYWGKNTARSQQYRDQVRLCCSVLATQLEAFHPRKVDWLPKLIDSYLTIRDMGHSSSTTYSPLFPKTIPIPTRTTTSKAKYDETLIELSALLSMASREIPVDHGFSKDEMIQLLTNSLMLCSSILDGDAFPTRWLSLYIYHHRSILLFLKSVSNVLQQQFIPPPDDADDFQTDLWSAYFSTLLKLCSNEALALETFPEQKRRAVWKIAGDVRELGSDVLQQSWQAIGWDLTPGEQIKFNLDKMGGYQVQYVPSLVGPIIELCLSYHEGLRGTAIEILRSMIVSEWTLSQDLNVLQAESISCLDRLFKTKSLRDSIPQKIFIADLLDPFDIADDGKREPLFLAVRDYATVLDDLLDLLIAVHANAAAGEAYQIIETLRLMEFLRDLQKEDIYVGYVHKLAQIQAGANNPTEAGIALKMHADLYDWMLTKRLPALSEPRFAAQTAFERKEQIYFQMIKHYEDGAAWNLALKAYGELAREYETNIFDFSKLARAQRAMAAIEEKISKGDRSNTRYYRVIFRGLGFSQHLRNRHFIFEALQSDRLPVFTDKLLQRYPSAQMANGGDFDDQEGQYLAVHAVGPQRNFLHPVNRRAKVVPSVREHFMLANPNQFTTTSRRQASTAGVQDQTVEKVIYTTAERFPTILRQSEIIGTESVRLSPIQIGLERINRKTQELIAHEMVIADGNDASLTGLTETLMGLVNPRSNASVAEYWDLIPQPRELEEDGVDLDEIEDMHEEEPILDPFQEALKVALIDHVLAIRRCLGLFARSAHQATKAELTKDFEQTFASILGTAEMVSRQYHTEMPNTSLINDTGFTTLSTVNRPNTNLSTTTKDTQSKPGATDSTLNSHRLSQNGHQHNFSTNTTPKMQQSNGFKTPSARTWQLSSRSSLSDVTNTRPSTQPINSNGNSNSDGVFEAITESLPSRPVPAQKLQTRVGSVTKRFSALNLTRKGTKSSMKSPGIDSVAE